MLLTAANAADLDNNAADTDKLCTAPFYNVPSREEALQDNMKSITPSEDMFTIDYDKLYPEIEYVDCSFNHLQSEINKLSPGEAYNIDRDYCFGTGDCLGIDIFTSDVTINGNGHTIDGSNDAPLFFVYGKNVRISNLTLTNSHCIGLKQEIGHLYYRNGRSPILWEGDGGCLENCKFYDNSAPIIGGAITWKGNDGVISNSLFINNTAGVIGGAVYLMGSNNRICNCMFLNSASKTGDEEIYVDRNHAKCFISAMYDGENLVTNGKYSNIDVDNLKYICETSFGGETINIIPLIYTAMMSQDTSVSLDSQVSYYAMPMSNGFLFTLSKRLSDRTVYQKNFYLSNVAKWEDVFNVLTYHDFKIDFSVTTTVTVDDYDDYRWASALDTKGMIPDGEMLKIAEDMKGSAGELLCQLQVNFAKSMVIDCDDTWDLSEKGFDVVNINGAGSTIKTDSGNRDEEMWATIDENCIFSASNLIIRGFNTAVENMGGTCIFNNVHFDDNHMKYIIDRYWGAAILNAGECICTNCIFTDNHCKNGGAIFTQGSLALNNCTFEGNEAYGDGDNVLNADKGKVYVDGNEIQGSQGCVEYVKSISDTWSTIVGISGLILSAGLGILAGMATGNPLIGVGVGVTLGACIGTICSVIIVSGTYDVHLNRALTCALLIGGCALAGGLGGAMGGFIAEASAAEAVDGIGIAEYEVDVSLVFSSSGLESIDTLSEVSSEWQEFVAMWYNDSVYEGISVSEEIIGNSLHLAEGII